MKPSMSVLEQILGWKGRLPDFRQHWPNGMNRSMTLSGNSASTKIAVIVPTLSEYSIRLHMVAFSSETRASFGMTVPNVYLNVTVSVPGSDVASCVMCVRPQHQHRSAREPQGSRSERTRERERRRERERERENERERERESDKKGSREIRTNTVAEETSSDCEGRGFPPTFEIRSKRYSDNLFRIQQRRHNCFRRHVNLDQAHAVLFRDIACFARSTLRYRSP